MKLPRTPFTVTAAVCLALMAGLAQAAQPESARLAELQKRVTAIATDTARVEAITQIQRLGRAYGYYLDKGFFGEAADLFTADASFQWGNDGIYKGKARIRELLTRQGGGSVKETAPGLPFGRLNLRMQLQPVVTIAADGRSAQGRWREWGLLGQYKKEAIWGDAVIEDRYVLEGGVWKIAARAYYLNFEAPYQGGWAVLKPGSGSSPSPVAKEFPPDAPSPQAYQPFPAVFTAPYHFASGTPSAIQGKPPITPVKRADDRVGKLEAMAASKELQLARAHSVRAIENLHGIYGYYIDEGQWKQAAALFTRNGTYESGQSGVYEGTASIERGLSLMGPPGLEAGQLNNYVMVQPIISVDAQNRTAKARWRNDVLLARAGQGRWGGGIYENEYVNENGTWKISKLHYHVTFWGEYEQGWGARPIPMDPPSTTNPPDRPPTVIYQSLPKLQVVPFHFDHPVTGRPHEVQ
jgi:hypothetical protein